MPPRPSSSRRPSRATPPQGAVGSGVAGRIRVEIADRQRLMAIDRRWLRDLVRRAVTAIGVPQAEIGLALVDDAGIAALHDRWMGLPDATDVITFDLAVPGGPGLHGDIAVSTETARRVARSLGWLARHELAYYVVHGLLHLAGEDDRDAPSRRKMRTREREVMAAIGLPEPPRDRRRGHGGGGDR